MLYSLAAVAFATLASAAMPAPPSDSSCMGSVNGGFEIQVINNTMSKRGLGKRDALMLTLQDGVLKDALGRIGYIAANSQFQFDKMAQPGSPFDAGWAVCPNNTLVLGPYAEFQACLSGDFYNLYLNNPAGQCDEVTIDVLMGGQGTPVSQQGDGQPTFIPVTQISDGQIQLSSVVPVTQISDGQIQVSTAVPSTGLPVSQISDGQIQVSTGLPVSQISDGQIQVSTAVPPMVTGKPVSQISDGQIQVPTGMNTTIVKPTQTIIPATGAASTVRGGLFGVVAAVLAIAML